MLYLKEVQLRVLEMSLVLQLFGHKPKRSSSYGNHTCLQNFMEIQWVAADIF